MHHGGQLWILKVTPQHLLKPVPNIGIELVRRLALRVGDQRVDPVAELLIHFLVQGGVEQAGQNLQAARGRLVRIAVLRRFSQRGLQRAQRGKSLRRGAEVRQHLPQRGSPAFTGIAALTRSIHLPAKTGVQVIGTVPPMA